MLDGFTPEFTITTTLKVGVVYKLTAPELIETNIPHYFIVVAIEEDDNYLCMCTSQEGSTINYFYKSGKDLDTLANIEPSSTNGLTKRTYVDCNRYFILTKTELVDKCEKGRLKLAGDLDIEEYELIRYSIRQSKVNDIPKFLLVHPDETDGNDGPPEDDFDD